MVESLRADVAVIGAGPAGIAAATRAAENGATVAVLDEGTAPGGQIWRRRAGATRDRARPAVTWLERLERSGADVRNGASVFDIRRTDAGFVVHAQCDAAGMQIELVAERLVIASGARERFLPFPGWTLQNVLGIGGAQALLKSGASFRGKRVVIAGSGPLLMPVAASMSASGARVVIVAEQASMQSVSRFALSLLGRPATLLEAAAFRASFLSTPYVTGTWVARADGERSVSSVTLATGSGDIRTVACDVLCTGYGLVPSTELARLAGCATRDGCVIANEYQRTNVPNLYSAGEPNGIGGVDCALIEGEIAGLCATGRERDAAPLFLRRDAARRAAREIDRAFALRPELCRLPEPDTIVCRCEDVAFAAISPDWTPRQAKLYTRAGMGACQGRVCGGALQHLYGWEADVVRPPVVPVPISTLLTSVEQTKAAAPQGAK